MMNIKHYLQVLWGGQEGPPTRPLMPCGPDMQAANRSVSSPPQDAAVATPRRAGAAVNPLILLSPRQAPPSPRQQDASPPTGPSGGPALALNTLMARHADTIFSDLGVSPDDKIPVSEHTARQAHNKISDAFSDYFLGRTANSQFLDEFLAGCDGRSPAEDPREPIFQDGCKLPAHLIDMHAAPGKAVYVASESPRFFSTLGKERGVEKYLTMLLNQKATAAVALIGAPWWPEAGETAVFGDVVVLCKHATEGQAETLHWQMRQCELKCGQNQRTLSVLICRNWPDLGGVSPRALASLIAQLEQQRAPGVTAVHCQAGRGRTGTFIAAHVLATQNKHLDGNAAYRQGLLALLRLRCQRSDMVETPQQFVAAMRAGIAYGQRRNVLK